MCIRDRILENLMETRQGKTTIVIAHRISTLQKADHVAVLSDGKLTEYGTPEELLELGGFYADISHKPVSYTHLDVYKRQRDGPCRDGSDDC